MATKLHIKFSNTEPPAPYLGNIPKKKNIFLVLLLVTADSLATVEQEHFHCRVTDLNCWVTAHSLCL